MKMPLTIFAIVLGFIPMFVSFTSRADMAAATAKPEAEATAAPVDAPILGNLNPAQRPLAELSAPSGNLKVRAWVERPNKTFAFGEKLTLNVKTDQDAYITVLNVGTSGKVHIVFPNQYQKDNRVAAGQIVQIPDPKSAFLFQVQGPAGTELLKVIATQSPRPLVAPEDTEPAGPFQTLKVAAPTTSKRLDVLLREQHNGGWAETKEIIHIVAPTLSGQTPPPAAPTVAVGGLLPSNPPPVVANGQPELFDLHLRPEKVVYPLGAKARVMVTAERDCDLTLLNIDTSGSVVILFPNRYQPANRLQAGKTITIPSETASVDYQVSGPVGVEVLIGLCRTDKQPVYKGNFNFEQHTYQPWGDAKTIIKDVAVMLREPDPALAHAAATFLVVEPWE